MTFQENMYIATLGMVHSTMQCKASLWLRMAFFLDHFERQGRKSRVACVCVWGGGGYRHYLHPSQRLIG